MALKAYFLGEFGLLNFAILGMLQQYEGEELQVLTFPDYLILMQKANPRVNALALDEIRLPEGIHRDSFRAMASADPAIVSDLSAAGVHELYSLLTPPKDARRLFFGKHGYFYMVPLLRKLTSALPLPNGQYISVCIRNRIRQPFRNSDPARIHSIAQRFGPLPIILHGLPEEALPIVGGTWCSDIEAAIGYLQKSVVFIGSALSGYTQFALNCGCDVIHVGFRDPLGEPVEYNPFGARVTFEP